MKRFIPLYGLLLACILLSGSRTIDAQERSLFSQTDTRDLIKAKVVPTVREPATKKNTPKTESMAARKKTAMEWVRKRCLSPDWKVDEWTFDGTYSGPVSDGKTWDAFTMRFSREVEFGKLSYRGSMLFYFDRNELKFPRNDWPIDEPPPGAFLVQVGDSLYEALNRDASKPLAEPKR